MAIVMNYVAPIAIFGIAIVPLFFLAKRPIVDVCTARNQSYGLTVSPEDEGTLYVAE